MGRIAKLIKTEIDRYIMQTVEAHYGQNQSAMQYGPSGEDSPPLKDDRILLVKVEGTGKYVAAGVLTMSQGANPGEKIFYSRDSDSGDIKAVVSLLNDGVIKLESPKDMIFEADGKVSIKGETTVTGDTKVTGGSFECGGTVTPTGSGALCGLPYCAFTGAPQAGSKSVGT